MAKTKGNIEITPKMLEAGVKATYPFFDEVATMPALVLEEAVEAVLLASVHLRHLKYIKTPKKKKAQSSCVNK